VLSLIFWSLTLIVSVKYVVYRAARRQQGRGRHPRADGARQQRDQNSRLHYLLITLGVFGAALLYGDGVITPAISVLSAVEGLEVAAPRLEPAVIPLTIAILVGLFAIQTPWHRRHRRAVRARDGGLVHHDRRARHR
jgi:KUP system potassium uptake protein